MKNLAQKPFSTATSGCYVNPMWGSQNTTEDTLISELDDDLIDAWERVRETALSFGEQRSYASHKSIMFSRKACYFFVRPKKSALEVIFFLGRTLKHPMIKKTYSVSKSKTAHIIYITHRDEVESPITDWLLEAYQVSEELSGRKPAVRKAKPKTVKAKSKPRKKKAAAKKLVRKKIAKPSSKARRVSWG